MAFRVLLDHKGRLDLRDLKVQSVHKASSVHRVMSDLKERSGHRAYRVR